MISSSSTGPTKWRSLHLDLINCLWMNSMANVDAPGRLASDQHLRVFVDFPRDDKFLLVAARNSAPEDWIGAGRHIPPLDRHNGRSSRPGPLTTVPGQRPSMEPQHSVFARFEGEHQSVAVTVFGI